MFLEIVVGLYAKNNQASLGLFQEKPYIIARSPANLNKV